MAHSESGADTDPEPDHENPATNTDDSHPPIETRDDGKPILPDAWEGTHLRASWGYGQTNVDFAKIVEVSDSGRTVLAQLVTSSREKAIRGNQQVAATEKTYGDTFRLHVRGSGDSVVFRGSYPYIKGDSDAGTRLETFSPHSGGTVSETPTNQGH